MANILVTGANGQLGKEFALCQSSKHDFFFTSSLELDIADKKALDDFVQKNDIFAIINCAAYTDIVTAEKENALADRVNYLGVKNLAQICAQKDIRLVHFSCERVFGAEHFLPIDEDSACEPDTYYGVSKLKGERIIAFHKPKNCLIIRSAWLYSVSGDNFVTSTIKLAKEKASIEVPYDQIGTPTSARDLAKFVVYLLDNDLVKCEKPCVYHYTNEGVASWYDFANEIISFLELPCEVIGVRSKRKTKLSPAYFSVLSTERLKKDFNVRLQYWNKSLRACLREIA